MSLGYMFLYTYVSRSFAILFGFPVSEPPYPHGIHLMSQSLSLIIYNGRCQVVFSGFSCNWGAGGTIGTPVWCRWQLWQRAVVLTLMPCIRCWWRFLHPHWGTSGGFLGPALEQMQRICPCGVLRRLVLWPSWALWELVSILHYKNKLTIEQSREKKIAGWTQTPTYSPSRFHNYKTLLHFRFFLCLPFSYHLSLYKEF